MVRWYFPAPHAALPAWHGRVTATPSANRQETAELLPDELCPLCPLTCDGRVPVSAGCVEGAAAGGHR